MENNINDKFLDKNNDLSKQNNENLQLNYILSNIKLFLVKYKKILILSFIVFISIIGLIFGYKKIKYINTPDALVNTSNMKIEIKVKGFDGYGKASYNVVGYPNFHNVKDRKKYSEINTAVMDFEVKLDKTENLKNGDEITALLKFNKSKNLKLKFDKDEIKVSIIVNDLLKLIKSYEDIANSIDRIEKKINENIISNLDGDKNIKIEKLKIFQKDINDEEIKYYIASENMNELKRLYSLAILYKVTYDEKKFTFFREDKYETKEMLFVENVDNFQNKEEVLLFEVNRMFKDKFSESNMEDYINKLILKNYKEIK